MERKPISPGLHGHIDYGFGVVSLGVPALLGLSGPARFLPAVWAVAEGTLNAFTDQPYPVDQVIPFATHGRVEFVRASGVGGSNGRVWRPEAAQGSAVLRRPLCRLANQLLAG